ncbi:N-6 DNA methylase [Mesorhizobium sp.]|uniref:HsdM family class I SAM-dependent methyltransferase n=1 Tax=Mesorhizobium sp. TaxID=1871066 RepID=UPI00257F2A25|nr:N-6 DNA methylase [Mesorhizobium sp.]
MNELTFAGWLAEFTAVRAAAREAAGESVLIAVGAIEERQVDDKGVVRRCDIRFNTARGRKLASGELKRPEVAEGRDVRSENLRADARRKALARGLPYYFTCNMSHVALYEMASSPREEDQEIDFLELAPIKSSGEAIPYRDQMRDRWVEFLDRLEERLAAVERTRPSVTTADVVALRDAIFAISTEASGRVARRLAADPALAEEVRVEAAKSFNFPTALDPGLPARFIEELVQILRFGAFVVAQKLVLYRVLEDAGPRRADPFALDALSLPAASTDPQAIRAMLDRAFALAIRRSGDYETAFLPEPFIDLLFTDPEGATEAKECWVGQAWNGLLQAVVQASWLSITQNIVGLLYEVIVEERFRHQLGQFYTPEDVVDVLTAFGIREPNDLVLDPATGGGSFLRSAYARKRAFGATHERSLADIWGCEITAFAAELSTVTLATSDTHEAAAYPRVLLRDFFEIRPGLETPLEIPGIFGRLVVPMAFDAVIGNPPYISYRHITNQNMIVNALASDTDLALPKFSGKSDAYLWFIVHATRFLRQGGRLAFVVSAGMIFSDYGIPLIRFLGRHYRICAIVDSIVERWFPEADTNTVLLFLERETDSALREANQMRFVRMRRPLAQIIPSPSDANRRGVIEAFLDDMIDGERDPADPRMQINQMLQGPEGGLTLAEMNDGPDLLDEDDE